MKYLLAVRDTFSAAHRLAGSGGRCENLHGHNFAVEIKVEGARLDGAGMVVDFTVLKNILRTILIDLDHTDLNSVPAFSGQSPSSERIAEYVFERAEELLSDLDVGIASVTVSESRNASATYLP